MELFLTLSHLKFQSSDPLMQTFRKKPTSIQTLLRKKTTNGFMKVWVMILMRIQWVF